MDPQQNVQRDLLTDGYFAQMFGPQVAEEYHTFLLKREPGQIGQIQPQTDVTGTGAFFAPPPPGSQARASGQHGWVIDHAVRDTSLVIRQKIWAPKNPSDKKRRVDHASEGLHPPIFFVHKNGRDLGLPLIEAAGGDCMRLRDADQVAPVGSSVHARIRINWCGYAYLDWNKQIMIQRQKQDQTQPKETISLETFAKHVATKTKDFMEFAMDKAANDNDADPKYFIGGQHITPRQIILIGAVHVSQGSWMPILQLNTGYAQCLEI